MNNIIEELQKGSGGAGYRSRYLSHAKRALYQLSYAPDVFTDLKYYILIQNSWFVFDSRNNNIFAPEMKYDLPIPGSEPATPRNGKKLTCRHPVSNLRPLVMASYQIWPLIFKKNVNNSLKMTEICSELLTT